MDIRIDARQRLRILMWLLAVHSLCIGLGLIMQPPEIIRLFGFDSYSETFFPAQGGVFHVVMSVCYALGAIDVKRFRDFIYFAIFVKTAAAVFLFSYYFFVKSIWMVLASGIGDGLAALLISVCFFAYKKTGQDQ